MINLFASLEGRGVWFEKKGEQVEVGWEGRSLESSFFFVMQDF
jgi:hypothetical protein